MGGSGGAEVHPVRKQAPICVVHARHAVRTGSKAVTAEDADVILLVLLSKMISPVPSIRSEGHRTAHGLSTSANWYGHWETAYVTA